jgi:hypothetical protein
MTDQPDPVTERREANRAFSIRRWRCSCCKVGTLGHRQLSRHARRSCRQKLDHIQKGLDVSKDTDWN